MLLTVYYLAATSFQSWRLRAVHQKIARVLDTKNTVVFHKKYDNDKNCMATISDICVNSVDATVQECIWSNDISQGISISPKQILYINPFITFPTAPSLVPFSYGRCDVPEPGKNDVIHALIEADLIPEFLSAEKPSIEIEAFTNLFAWKIDTKLSILVKTSPRHLSQLIFASFVQNNYTINDHLQLSRIQTVNIDGSPQDYDQIIAHTKHTLPRSNELLSPVNWDKHLDGIKSLGVLANQASEFEFKKNLTEGKTGIVQPDLISSKNIEELARKAALVSPDTPKKSLVKIEKTEEKIRELRKQNDGGRVEGEQDKLESPKFPVTPSKSAKSTKASENVTSPKFPVGSPGKKSFFEAKRGSMKDGEEVNNGDTKKSSTSLSAAEKTLDSRKDTRRSTISLTDPKLSTTSLTDVKTQPITLKDVNTSSISLVSSNQSLDNLSDAKNSLTNLTDPKTSATSLSDVNNSLKSSTDTLYSLKSPLDAKNSPKSSSDLTNLAKFSPVSRQDSKVAKLKVIGDRIDDMSSLSDKIKDVKAESAKLINSENYQGTVPGGSDKFPISGSKTSFSSGFGSSKPDSGVKKMESEQGSRIKKSDNDSGSVDKNLEIEIGSGVIIHETDPGVKKLETKQLTLKDIGKKAEIEESTSRESINLLTDPGCKVSKPAPEAPHSLKSRPPVQRSRKKLMEAKPPNVLVYSDSTTTRSNVIKTLGDILKDNMYTIYALTEQQVRKKVWLDNTTLLVVCGAVNGSDISQIFLEYFFKGGKVLCLCSDLLRQVLPTYHTAEVREHELVQFSYGQWKNIVMMHHIFCYQPSPIRKHFSQEGEEPPKEKPNTNPLIVLPRSIELKDELGLNHNVHVQILGTEDTWKTPSLLMVYADNGAKIIFSQIHLEIDPSFYEDDEQKYQILKKNDNLRHEIFGDVLSTHLGLATMDIKGKKDSEMQFTKGYFLGRHELKFEILEQIKPNMDENNTMKIDGLSVKFCGKNDDPPKPKSYCLPVMIHSCPDDFSTLDYFDNLKTVNIGRAVIYSHILTNTMSMINKMKYCHGMAIVSRILTRASGRANNMWLSPEGCLMFTLQLHIPLNSPLGQRISLIQHLVATSVVMAIKNIPGCEHLDINVKWPNDIYANGERKIGGLIVNSTIDTNQAICNIGLGLNLSNSIPTTCINDMIMEYNKNHSKNLKPLTLETTLAIIFNEIENILNRIQAGDIEYLYELYYSCWLHTDTSVKVVSSNGLERNGTILGIDEYGFLKIQLDNNQIESVQPDGNTFDMLRGLIVPKTH